MKHDAHIRLEVSGGKTEYDGVYATEKQSKVNVEKSKISPVMNGIRMKIDITKGGVIDRPGSLVWWMTELEKPSVFKSGAWWSIEDWCYEKYKAYWDRIGGLYPKFRQAELYNKASEPDSPLVDLLRLIWVDLISERYVLQAEICKPVKTSLEASLALKLGVTEEDLRATNETNNEESETTEEIVSGLADVLGLTVDTETGEVM